MSEAVKLNMTVDEETIWARDLACFYAVKGLHTKAVHFFEKCFELYESEEKPKNPYVLHRYSQSKRALASPEEAVISAEAALRVKHRNLAFGLEVSNCIYELNRLEDAFAHNCNSKRLHFGLYQSFFQNKLDALVENFDDTVGESYLGFLCLNKDSVFESWKINELKKFVDDRPLWKIQKELGNCDVLSVLEKEEVMLCPREAARRKRALTVFTQYYLGLSSKDLEFLTHCLHRDSLLLDYSIEITPLLRGIIATARKDVQKYLAMVHCRNPLYNVNYRKFSKPGQAYTNTELTLNRVQNQTRRAMHNVLKTVKAFRKDGNLRKLTEFVEEVMGDMVPVKTLRVMPMRFEFICEVYNHLALAYLECFVPPPDMPANLKGKNRLFALFKLQEDDTKPKVKQFGDKSSYIEQIKNEEASEAYKKYLQRMEKRLLCAKYPIEKSYIYYQIAHKHLGLHYYDMCSIVGARGIKEAKLCNSIAWQLLCLLEISKSHVCLQKIEILKENFNTALELACKLKSANLWTFITGCIGATMEELAGTKLKKPDRSRSLLSNRSSTSFDKASI